MEELVNYIGEAIKHIDEAGIPYRNYQPGVGPYGEPQLARKVVGFLKQDYPKVFRGAVTKRVPDVLIPNRWALEFKIVRPFGDNGKEAELWSQNLIHPYEGNVSSIGDAIKLASANLNERKGLIVIAYEHTPPKIHVELLVKCFEHITQKILKIPLGERKTKVVENLIHPVHQQCKVYGWELGLFRVDELTDKAFIQDG